MTVHLSLKLPKAGECKNKSFNYPIPTLFKIWPEPDTAFSGRYRRACVYIQRFREYCKTISFINCQDQVQLKPLNPTKFSNKVLCIDPAPEDEKGVKHAVLVGVISTSQHLAEMAIQETSTSRRQMSEQVSNHGYYRVLLTFSVKMISRVQPVLDWINFHIQSGHECVPKVSKQR